MGGARVRIRGERLLGRSLRRRRRRASDWATVEGEQRPRRKAPARCKRAARDAMIRLDNRSGCVGRAGRDQRIVVCFDLQSVGQQAFLPHVRALIRTNGVAVGGGGRGVGGAWWCRERWTPRRDLMKPSRGLLKPARCAVALVQLAVPTGGLLQAIEAADIKRALRG